MKTRPTLIGIFPTYTGIDQKLGPAAQTATQANLFSTEHQHLGKGMKNAEKHLTINRGKVAMRASPGPEDPPLVNLLTIRDNWLILAHTGFLALAGIPPLLSSIRWSDGTKDQSHTIAYLS